MKDVNNDKKFVCKETFWWEGFEIIPPRPKMGLLSAFANRKEDTTSSEETTEEEDEETSSATSSESDEGSAESNPMPKKVITRKKLKKKRESKLWQNNLSARNNQDIQRAYEEIAVKEMSAILNKNSVNDTARTCRSRNSPIGGLWVRLEAEWKEACNLSQSHPKQKNIFTTGKIKLSRGK